MLTCSRSVIFRVCVKIFVLRSINKICLYFLLSILIQPQPISSFSLDFMLDTLETNRI